MALTQDQVNAWFDANPNATADDVAAAVKSIGGLEANQGLAGMIANRFSIAEPEVTNYYNAYTAPKDNAATFTDTITSGPPTTQEELLTTLASTPTTNTTSTTAGAATNTATDWPSIIYGTTDEEGGRLTTTTTSDGTPFYVRDADEGGYYQNPNTVETYVPFTGTDGKTYYAVHAPVFSSGVASDKTPVTGIMTEAQFRAFQGGSSFGDAIGNIVNSPVGSFALGVLGPYGQAINAVNQADKGNYLGAILSGTGAAQGFGVTDIGGFDIKTVQNVARGLNAINKDDLIGAFTAGSNLFGGIPGDYTTVTNLAGATLALKNNDTAGFLSAVGDLTGSADTKTAAAAAKLLAAVTADNPNIANIQAAVNGLNTATKAESSAPTGSTGSTTVGDFEDTEVTRLKGLGYTKEKIQEYFRNLDNLTGLFDETSTLGADTQTGGSTTGAADTTSTSGTGATDLDDLIDTLTVTGANTDSGLSNQTILDMINGTDDTVVVTGKTDKDTVTGVDTITGVDGTGTDGTDKDGTVTVVGDRECAAGFHRDDVTGLCVADSDQQALDCPEGYEPNDAGTACIPKIEIVDKKCDPGFVYDEDLKQCVAIKPEGCAPGFHDDGTGFCVPDTDLDCPEGYEPNEAGTACIPVVEIKDKKCGPGFVYDEELQKCVAVEDDTCAPGFHRDDVTGLCVADEEGLDCPEGYEPNEAGTACIPIIEIVDNKCKPGYVFDEALQKCVPIDDDKCATGFHRDEVSGLCVPDDDEECKDGYEKVNGVCVPVCKEGYIRNLETGICEKVDDKACPVGQVRNAEGKCVPIVTPPPPPPPPPKTCPTGFKLVNGTCVPIATTPTYTPSGSYGPGEKNEPIYAGGMDEFNLLATLQELLAEEAPKKDDKKSKDKTKMATGGHLDDLLAEQMTVDDLLKLLR